MIYIMLLCLIMIPIRAGAIDGIDYAIFQTSISGTTQDITIPGIGTPDAVLIFLSRADQEIGVNIENHALFVIGAYDGTNQYSTRVNAVDAVTTTQAGRSASSTQCLLIDDQSDGSADGRATCSFITNGVRFTWTDAPSFAYYTLVIFFYGDIQARVGTFTMGALSSVSDVTAPGFTPDQLIMWSIGCSTTATGEACPTIGFADRTSGQASFGHMYRNSQTTALAAAAVTESYAIQAVDFDVREHGCSVSDWDANGFSCTVGIFGNSVSTSPVYYVALKYASSNHHVGVTTSPGTTGLTTHSGPGFEPSFALFVPTNNTAFDTLATTSDNVGYFGICAVTTSKHACLGTIWEDATSSQANVASLYDSGPAMRCNEDDQTTAYLANLDSMTATGPRLDYSVVEASNKILMLTVGGSVPAQQSSKLRIPLFFE